jgi:hypothetical protein
MTVKLHASKSPSSAFRWTSCTASVAAQDGKPDSGSEAARNGTACHQVSAECLISGADPQTYLGRGMLFPADGGREDWISAFPPGTPGRAIVEIDQDMVDACRIYITFVRDLVATQGAEMIVEQRVPISHITGETGATGTSDVILIAGDTLICIDAKFGRGRVPAYDEIEEASFDVMDGTPIPPKLRMNLQCAMYLLGAYEKYGLMGDFKTVKTIIVQPYLRAVSEYTCSLEELLELGEWIKSRAWLADNKPEFVPSQDNCHFCRARMDCHARQAMALSSCLEGFEDVSSARPKPIALPNLGLLYSKVGLIRQWCNDVEKKALNELAAGKTLLDSEGMRYKLVAGRAPHRQWVDESAIEALMLEMRIKPDVMYTRKLITPSAAEKLAETQKGKRKDGQSAKPIGKIKWKRLAEHIYTPDAKPVIAPHTDPRPKLDISSEGFGDVPPTDNSDLF